MYEIKENSNQMPPFSFEPGAFVNALAKSTAKAIWRSVVKATNEVAAKQCNNNCNGCKQLSGKNPCETARMRYALIFHMGVIDENEFEEACANDLLEYMFADAPYYVRTLIK